MFSIFKQASSEVVLKDLSEGQLAEVAGGYGCYSHNDHDADDKHYHHNKHKHHHHKHHHHMMHKWVKPSHSSWSASSHMHW